ncbi:threonyl-tRNA synthetase [Bacillus pakistanensis]|uniref:Threonine--tRNA ligase n=1 Tax=Rossellomorea pakistanensis TaxID=992288 RepID=A0ABS2N7B9_9BACI|nr:threonine--tRNA ligase [Bacillus pakistanensis]MBM7583750.1 threonyl-tRNA synthetase [Bacillus pakistanensis]
MSKQMEVEKRNHRKLGHDLELFMSVEEAPGMPIFLPNGMLLRNELEKYWKDKHFKAGYQEIKTPILMKQEVWEQSGHWDHYHDSMYFSEWDQQNYAIKPMSCPGAIFVYNSKRRSYRALPMRFAELGLVHRPELSGSLSGLLRVRSFTQDDAHLFVRKDQVEAEIVKILELIDEFYSRFGFQYKVELSTRPEDYMGSEQIWEHAEKTLESVLNKKGLEYAINPGDGAFYGPKIDFHILDALGRSWQCGTIQLDFLMPEKFDCHYIDEDNNHCRPIMIHRAIYGSVERFMAILIEHFEGEFPIWLSPIQVKILPIADAHLEFAVKIKSQLESEGIRVEVDNRVEKIGLKIRDAQMKKIPYMLVVGDQEVNNNSISVRHRIEGNSGEWKIDAFLNKIGDEIYE